MKVEECLIFSAGLGTRMGELGKVLPKPAWPLFETTLLGAQVEFAMALGCKRIFVNAHHLYERLKEGLPAQYRSNVTFVYEEEIMGSGGGIHNIVEKNLFQTDTLLTLNSDTFFFIPRMEEWEKIFEQLSGNRCLLVGAEVSEEGPYREMVIQDGRLMGFNDSPSRKDFITYAGMGLLNLDGLVPVKGKSNFFESVANCREESVQVVSMPRSEFWDFGTRECYKKNIYDLIGTLNRGEKTLLTGFLLEKGLIDLKKVGMASYGSTDAGGVNFTSSNSLKKDGDGDIIMIEAGENRQIYLV